MSRFRLTIFSLVVVLCLVTLPALAQEALPLTETFRSDGGKVVFNYPAGWALRTDSNSDDFILTVSLATSEATLDKSFGGSAQDAFLPGEAQMLLFVADVTAFAATVPGITLSSTPVEILNLIIKNPLPEGFTLGEIESASINDLRGAQLHLDGGESSEGRLLVIQLRQGVIGVAGMVTAPGELTGMEATMQAVLGSIKLDIAPVAAPTAVATLDVSSDLSATYTNESGNVSFAYPAGWIVDARDDDSIYLEATISSVESVMNKDLGTDAVFAPDEVKVQLFIADRAAFLGELNLSEEDNPLDLLNALIQQGGANEGLTFDAPTATSIEDKAGAEIRVRAGENGSVWLLTFNYRQDVIVLLAVLTAPGGLDAAEALGRAVAESISVSESATLSTPESVPTVRPLPTEVSVTAASPDLSETLTTGNGKASLSYPAGWVTRPFSASGVYLANGNSGLNHTLGGAYAPGEVQILVAVDTIANLTPQINLGLQPEASALKFLQAAMKVTAPFFTYEEPEQTERGGLPAATVVGHGDSYDGYAVVIELGDQVIALVQVLTAPGELPTGILMAEAIAATINFQG